MSAKTTPKIWEGVYRSFAEAGGDRAVFDGEIWLEKAVARAKDVMAQAAPASTISPSATSNDYFLPVVAALAASKGKVLHVLDFGGSLATSYFALEAMIPADRRVSFEIVETAAVCKRGRELFSNRKNLSFRTTVPGADERFDIVHCGSSLHYVENWAELLDRFAALQPQYLIFSDLPAADNRTFVTTQLFYGSRIPVHFWNVGEFIASVEAMGFELVLKARFAGYHAAADMAARFTHFDPEYRLNFFSQLVFRQAPSPSSRTGNPNV